MCKTDYTQLSAFLASFFMLLLLPSLQAQTKDTIFFKAVSYNVENLFDTEDDSLKNDNEFLPTATRHWDYRKYRKKLDNLAKVIIAYGGGGCNPFWCGLPRLTCLYGADILFIE